MAKPKDPDYFKKYYREHRADLIKQVMDNYRYNKTEVYRLYGNKCNCCGISEISVLCIDHVNNDGNIHRKKLKGGGNRLYRDILKTYDTDKDRFQLLCANCNMSKEQLGVCYHKIKI